MSGMQDIIKVTSSLNFHKFYERFIRFERGFFNGKHKAISCCGESEVFSFSSNNWFEADRFIDKNKANYLYIAISYDLKNHLENLTTKRASKIDFPLFEIIVPEVVIIEDESGHNIIYQNNKSEFNFDELHKSDLRETIRQKKPQIVFGKSKEGYIRSIDNLKKHIALGDIYEVNFCIEAAAEQCDLDVVATYKQLIQSTEPPFGVFYKNKNQYALCASPERFLLKTENRLLAQPMKGTAKRSSDLTTDNKLKKELEDSLKEQTENVMIVDLMRNDLSKIAKPKTVNVDELFGVYTFKNVHQMISTVSCELKDAISFADILKATFPMGSMTGAPKIRAMQLIDENEGFARNLFSGCLGYFTPGGNFDLNVVIRTIFYDANQKKVVCRSGSAITANAVAELEYDECLLKMESLLNSLCCD